MGYRNLTRLSKILIVVGVTIGVLIRGIYLTGDLWLDEIWTLYAAHKIGDFPALDGHLSLFTILSGFFPVYGAPFLYRLPGAVAALVGTCLLIFCTPNLPLNVRKWWALIAVPSFLLSLYGSEARPYGLMICFGSLSLLFYIRSLTLGITSLSTQRKWGYVVAFWLNTLLACAFHLTFVFTYVGLGIFSALAVLKTKKISIALHHLALHFVPLLALGVAWILYLHDMPPGYGLRITWPTLFVELLSTTLGGPSVSASSPRSVMTALILALGAICICGYSLTRLKLTTSVFLLCVGVAGPLFVILAKTPPPLYPRYFIMQSMVVCFLVAYSLAKEMRAAALNRVCALFIAGTITLGNLAHAIHFSFVHRGSSSAMTKLLLEEKATTIGVDNPFRIPMILNYERARSGDNSGFKFGDLPKQNDAPTETLSHLVLHSFDPFISPRSEQNGCRLVKVFNYAGLAGWSSAIYRCGEGR